MNDPVLVTDRAAQRRQQQDATRWARLTQLRADLLSMRAQLDARVRDIDALLKPRPVRPRRGQQK